MIYLIVKTKKYRLEFYDSRVIVHQGIFNTQEQQSLLTSVVGVRVDRSFGGNIFNYGNVIIDVVGRWDVDTVAIKDPESLKSYIESLMNHQDSANLQQFIMN